MNQSVEPITSIDDPKRWYQSAPAWQKAILDDVRCVDDEIADLQKAICASSDKQTIGLEQTWRERRLDTMIAISQFLWERIHTFRERETS